jgi:L-methionine (R)-S-oxide reductase
MAEELLITKTLSKREKYLALIPQLKHLVEGETNLIANLANICAALRQTFGFFWVGFYLVQDNNTLVLGPFQGDIACTRIAFGKGVCGAAWQKAQTVLVSDVNAFPGHIACSSLSKSEIVVPVFNLKNDVVMVLDVDSDTLNDFDETDAEMLEEIAKIITLILKAE